MGLEPAKSEPTASTLLLSPFRSIQYSYYIHSSFTIHHLGQYNSIFIHSFTPLQVHYYSRSAPDKARILCRSFTPKRHRQLQVKDLPKVPMWRLEWDSNPPRPSSRMASTLPMRHHHDIDVVWCIVLS